MVGARVIAFVAGRLFGGAATRERFEANIAAAGLTDVVELVVGYSTKPRPTWTRSFDLLHVDGKHDCWTYVDDLRWSVHRPAGGEILVHDCFSSIGVTPGTIAKVLFGSRCTYVDRSRSPARFVSGGDELSQDRHRLAHLVGMRFTGSRGRCTAPVAHHDHPGSPSATALALLPQIAVRTPMPDHGW